MHALKAFMLRLLLAAALCCLVAPLSFTQAQDKTRKNSSDQTDEVVRINTELVQTDVTVLDKQGRFVEGLKREQFELSVEGKPQSISLFEPVIGPQETQDERAATKETGTPGAANVSTPRQTVTQGRLIFFFIDDVHLAPANLARARKALLGFIDNKLGQNDRAAIVSTSGQIGFLQQLTDNQAVLREAVTRLNNRRNPETIASKVAISESDAAQVSAHFNRELFKYLVQATAAEFQTDEGTAANIVKNRVQQINAQSRMASVNTLGALLSLMRSSAPLPGRKIVFFITDGFVADPRVSNVFEILRQVTRAAAQVGAVVYPMDARGIFAEATTDASRNDYPDYTGSVSRNLLVETAATQEPLQTLAGETGGRAFLNSNSFQDGFTRALNESSSYYLLAWRPRSEEERSAKVRIAVSVRNRPDLKVRVRRGFLAAPTVPAIKHQTMDKASASTPAVQDDELRAALGALYPVRALPVALSVGYMNSPKGDMLLLASMQIEAEALTRDPSSEAGKTEVDVLGVAIDDRGALSSFKQKLTINDEASAQGRPIVWNQQLTLAPGLYQVRVAVRERASGRTGSAMQWLEVPDLSGGRFNLSSLFLGERKSADAGRDEKFATAPRSLMVDVDHRFARTSVLRFQTYVYNAARANQAPNVSIQARIFRNDAAVIVMPPARLPTDTTPDKARLPYWAELSLDRLPPGSYVLRVTATDSTTKAVATQQAAFMIE